MNTSWKDQKTKLCTLIKDLSDVYGGDDREWLKEYTQEIMNKYKTNLSTPIACFEDLLKNLKINNLASKSEQITNICKVCHFVPPFCLCST